MTVARENIALSPGVSLSPLAARLELLLRRTITVEQFEADMVSCCEAHPDEVWNLLALLDQYHRLERLPTDLYRALKAATDRYGLVRREPYIPYVSLPGKSPPERGVEPVVPPPRDPTPVADASTSARMPLPAPESPVIPAAPTIAPSPLLRPSTPAPPATSMPPPAASIPPPAAPVAGAGTPAADFASAPGGTPFRHLLNDEPATDGQPAIGDIQGAWQGSRHAAGKRPPRRSKARAWLLPTLLLAIALGAAAWLKQGQGSVNMLAGPEDAQRAPSAAPDQTPSTRPETAPVPAPSFSSEPAPTSGATRAPASAPAPAPAAVLASPTAMPPSPAAVLASPPATPISPAAVLASPPVKPASSAAALTSPPAAATSAPAVPATPASGPKVLAQPAAASPGPSTVEFASDTYTVRPGDSAARILVRRSGDLKGELNFVWWTENATALANLDYVAWGHRSEKIPSGHTSVTLLVPVINDSTRTAPRRFQVVIGPADKGAHLGATTHATVQLSGTS